MQLMPCHAACASTLSCPYPFSLSPLVSHIHFIEQVLGDVELTPRPMFLMPISTSRSGCRLTSECSSSITMTCSKMALTCNTQVNASSSENVPRSSLPACRSRTSTAPWPPRRDLHLVRRGGELHHGQARDDGDTNVGVRSCGDL